MNKKDKKYIRDCIKNEGFDCAFRFFSEFTDIEDKKFHEFLQKYIKAAKELEEYIKT